MTDAQQSDTSERGDQPGKTRTWWHPLLARMLDFVLAAAFKVEEEVAVGKMPLRVDILLVRPAQRWRLGMTRLYAAFVPGDMGLA